MVVTFFLCTSPFIRIGKLKCPLCSHEHVAHYYTDRKRQYHQCSLCKLVFVSPVFLPSVLQEKNEYDLHQNAFDDKGYVNYLSRTLHQAALLSQQTSPVSSSVLDFGCGPVPVLAALMTKEFAYVSYYDPIYFPLNNVLKKKYDIITCTEAIEHFHTPNKEWRQLLAMLKGNGVIIIMTKRVLSIERFANWHYKNDPTHVSFFSESTFRFLAARDGLSVQFPTSDIAVFSKLATSSV